MRLLKFWNLKNRLWLATYRQTRRGLEEQVALLAAIAAFLFVVACQVSLQLAGLHVGHAALLAFERLLARVDAHVSVDGNERTRLDKSQGNCERLEQVQ